MFDSSKKKVPYTMYILQKHRHIKCRNDTTQKDGAYLHKLQVLHCYLSEVP